MERFGGIGSAAAGLPDGPRNRGHDPLIFDLDGVLWDTSSLHEEAFNEVCRSNGLTPVPYEQLAGRTTEDAWQVIAAANGMELDASRIEELRDRKQLLARARLKLAPPLSPEIGIVAAVSGRWPLGLVTGASAGTTDIFLQAAAISFDVVVTAADVNHGKPDPEPYLLAGTKLGASPSRCWVLEDSTQGLDSAVKAGMRAVHLSAQGRCAMPHVAVVACVSTVGEFVRLATTGAHG